MSGLLITMTEPPPEMEEEFNAWYDTEHLPERLAIPGFLSARRWVARDLEPGKGKYFATYELKTPGVLYDIRRAAQLERPENLARTRIDRNEGTLVARAEQAVLG